MGSEMCIRDSHQRDEIKRLRAMRIRRPVDAAAHHHPHPRRGHRHRHRMFEDRNHAELTASGACIGVVHVRLGVAHYRGIVEQMFGHNQVRFFLTETERVFDRVASGEDRVLLALAAVDMTPGLMTELLSCAVRRE